MVAGRQAKVLSECHFMTLFFSNNINYGCTSCI
nr:hypothetical protein [Suid alphaherpesvirus 1]